MIFVRALSIGIIPLLLLVGAWLALDNISAIDATYKPLLAYLPYVFLCLSMGLAYQFNRVRSFSAGLTLGVVYFAIQAFLQSPLEETLAHFVYTAISLLVPLNLLVSLVLPEKGMRHLSGLLLLALVPFEIGGLWLWYGLSSPDSLPLTAVLPVKPYAGYVLSIGASIGFGAAALLALAYIAWRRVDTGPSLLFSLVAVFCVLAWLQKPYISVVMISVAGVMLMVDLLKNTYNMAYRDELTGILGRRALNEKLRSLGRRYTVAMLDIDHFKSFNDTHGHDVGDEVLKLVAKKISEVTGGGKAYRYGGEEFTLVFSGASTEECRPHLEALRETIANYPLVLRNKSQRPKSREQGATRRGRKGNPPTVSITVSIGISERSEALRTPDQVIKAADSALYQAKKKGRNCVV